MEPRFCRGGPRSRPPLPGGPSHHADWPAAYAADDSRINTISFVAWAEASAAVGIKADPRTEEILNIDIVVGNALLWT